MSNIEALVTLGGPTVAESYARVDKAVEVYDQESVSTFVVTGAFWAFESGEHDRQQTMGRNMGDYARSRGIPGDALVVADQSLDTIGDALVSKHVLLERGFSKIGLVTTASHLGRAAATFTHVLGPGYQIVRYNAGEFPGRRNQRLYEFAGGMLARTVLADTEPGDDEAIMRRLFALVPGYTDAGKPAILGNHIRHILRLPFAEFEPSRQLGPGISSPKDE